MLSAASAARSSMASNSGAIGAVTGEVTPVLALFSQWPFSRRSGRNRRNCWGLRRIAGVAVTPTTPITPFSAIASPRIVRRRRATRSALIAAPVEDRRSDDENALGRSADSAHLLETVRRPAQYSGLPEGPRDQFGIKPGAYFAAPCLRGNEPFPFEALTLTPAGAVRNGASFTVVERLKSIVAVRLDKPPHLFNGLPGFRWFRSAALAYPVFKRPSSGPSPRPRAKAPPPVRSPIRPLLRLSRVVAPRGQPGHPRRAGRERKQTPQ